MLKLSSFISYVQNEESDIYMSSLQKIEQFQIECGAFSLYF